jgi:4a-hydroxytetrahydrobiopterin dehydratase
MTALVDRQCRPIPASAGRLPADDVAAYLAELGEPWRVVGDRLRREYKVADFAAAVVLVQEIGAIADDQDHHPDLTVSYGKVGIELWTHTVGGLSESDFIVAAKVDRAFAVMQGKLGTSTGAG